VLRKEEALGEAEEEEEEVQKTSRTTNMEESIKEEGTIMQEPHKEEEHR